MAGARTFFSTSEQTLLVKAIEQAELNTSGEIRLHLANFCLGDPIKAATRVFKDLRMHQTIERNGVLIYIAVSSKKMAIVGDVGIHEKLGQAYWDQMASELLRGFRESQKAQVLETCILDLGKRLGEYFPRKGNDRNELSNSISY